MKKTVLISALISIVVCLNLTAATEDGGYAGAFLKMAIEARPAAMGGAYVGFSNDAAGQLYNPAGLQTITTRIFSSSYRLMKLDRKMGFISMVLPTRLQSALGVSWLYAGYGDVEGRDKAGFLSGEMISSNEHVFGVSFAKRFVPYLGLGVKLNFYLKKHAGISANSIGIDLGGLLHIDSLFPYGSMEYKAINDIQVGGTIKHIAAKYPWEEEDVDLAATRTDEFPMAFALGASFKTFKRKLLVAADLEKNTKQSFLVRLGAEYFIDRGLRIRSGVNDGTLTAGAGFSFELDRVMLVINYAFVNERVDEGSDHIFTLDLNF